MQNDATRAIGPDTARNQALAIVEEVRRWGGEHMLTQVRAVLAERAAPTVAEA